MLLLLKQIEENTRRKRLLPCSCPWSAGAQHHPYDMPCGTDPDVSNTTAKHPRSPTTVAHSPTSPGRHSYRGRETLTTGPTARTSTPKRHSFSPAKTRLKLPTAVPPTLRHRGHSPSYSSFISHLGLEASGEPGKREGYNSTARVCPRDVERGSLMFSSRRRSGEHTGAPKNCLLARVTRMQPCAPAATHAGHLKHEA